MTEGLLIVLAVLIGALIALIGTNMNNKLVIKQLEKKEKADEKMKEIDTLMLLNKKIHDILNKRDVEIKRDLDLEDYRSFNNFDDVQITIDDYIYLQSFCAQNHYYLPSYMVEEFFKNINHRKIVLDPEDVRRLGGYTYQSGRLVLEKFSDEIVHCMEDRKIELKQIKEK